MFTDPFFSDINWNLLNIIIIIKMHVQLVALVVLNCDLKKWSTIMSLYHNTFNGDFKIINKGSTEK